MFVITAKVGRQAVGWNGKDGHGEQGKMGEDSREERGDNEMAVKALDAELTNWVMFSPEKWM